MPNEYREARKRGIKEYKVSMNRGEFPYLSVLDDILPTIRQTNQSDLGLISIPLKFVVGTKTAGRTNAFARNFMPLLDEESEFAVKWEQLCKSHMEEGIREPIICYEYFNRYYVQEGNKRVSVLKYCDAVTVMAQVIRILPERTEDESVKQYFEFIEFQRLSHINDIELSDAGAYEALISLVGKEQGEMWTEDDTKDLRFFFHDFEKAYRECGGDKLSITAADAMLVCLKIHGYDKLKQLVGISLKKFVENCWEEILLHDKGDDNLIKVQLDPDAAASVPTVSDSVRNLLFGGKKLEIAYIHDKTPETSEWTRAHDQAREYVDMAFGEKIHTKAYYNALTEDEDKLIRQAIDDGAGVIFTTSPRMLPASLRAAIDYPSVTIYNCSLNKAHKLVKSYYARMYEAKFIIGAIAGAMAKDGKIGYICNIPINGLISGINAFTRGVQMVNPDAKVYLEWSSILGIKEAEEALIAKGMSVISCQESAQLHSARGENFGLVKVENGESLRLATPIWVWEKYYELLAKKLISGSAEVYAEGKAVNHYWGMKSGVIDVVFTENVPPMVRRLGELLRDDIRSGRLEPFETLPIEEIIGMDYLAEGVVGEIPAIEELPFDQQDTVRQLTSGSLE